MTIHNITFSPTGGTRRVGELLCNEFGGECVTTELCTKEENLKLPGIHTDDLTVISMPVYAGRVPAMAVERLKGIEANGARCVIIAVYGNRAYEDALVEMQDVATGMGFRVVAAIAAIAEHSICPHVWLRPSRCRRCQRTGFVCRRHTPQDQGGWRVCTSLPAGQPTIQAGLQGSLPHSKRQLHGLRNVCERMSCRSHFSRQSERQRQRTLHRLHAMRSCMSGTGKGYRGTPQHACGASRTALP